MNGGKALNFKLYNKKNMTMNDLNRLKTLLNKVFSKCLKQAYYYIYMPDFRGDMQVLMKERPCTSNMIRNSLKEIC